MLRCTKKPNKFIELSHLKGASYGKLIMEKTMSTQVEPVRNTANARAPLPPVEKSRALNASAPPALQSPFAMTDARGEQSGLGNWVFNHKSSFSRDNPLAWYGVRNVANNMVSIVGLMATIVPVRMGMGHVAKWADARGMAKTQAFFSNTVLQNSLGVGASFATFRTLYKMGQRAYDRVFINPDDASETTQAINDLPHNWWKDFKQIAPAEFPATYARPSPHARRNWQQIIGKMWLPAPSLRTPCFLKLPRIWGVVFNCRAVTLLKKPTSILTKINRHWARF
jgi:hypothetical protein